MKLSNQNIYNLRGCKNFWGRCQMPLDGGGGANPFWWGCAPSLSPPQKNDKLRYAGSRMFTGPYAGFFHQGAVRSICRKKSQISEE
jgi:hypothetical protein